MRGFCSKKKCIRLRGKNKTPTRNSPKLFWEALVCVSERKISEWHPRPPTLFLRKEKIADCPCLYGLMCLNHFKTRSVACGLLKTVAVEFWRAC